MSSVEGLVGIERNGTVRKLCLVHSIIASGHGGREKKKGRGCLVWDFLLLLANFLLGQRSVTIKREIERERERERLVFLFTSIITLLLFSCFLRYLFPWANHVSQGRATDGCLVPPFVIAICQQPLL